jgi:8-oxo-dGTP diphosphatase
MKTPDPARRGVVAVVAREDRFLVIKRSRHVRAPGAYCFPGGWIEADESEPAALVRELREELRLESQAGQRIWESVTPWGVRLVWWTASLCGGEPLPNPDEVETVHWLTPDEMLALPQLLESNRDFLAALAAGEIRLPDLT